MHYVNSKSGASRPKDLEEKQIKKFIMSEFSYLLNIRGGYKE